MREYCKFWREKIKTKIMKTPIQNRKQLEFDMTVYHTEVYNGNEPLKVVGIRKSQVELNGDYSGVGLDNSSCWLPLNGTLLVD